MFIISKNRDETFNLDHTNRIYIKDNVLRIATEVTHAGVLGVYESTNKAKAAFEICMKRIALKEENVYMPSDIEVQKYMENGSS